MSERKVGVAGKGSDITSGDKSTKASKLTRSAEQAGDGSEAATGLAWSSQDGEASRIEDWDATMLLAALGLDGEAANDEGVQLASMYYAEGDGGGGGGGGGSASSQPASQPVATVGDPSWVDSEKKVVDEKERVVSGKAYPTFEAVALKFFGKKSLWPFVAKENPTLQPTKIGPATKIKVPASVEVPKAADQLTGDPSSTTSIMNKTWDVERNPKSAEASRIPTVPTDSSGVTLGRGYDMKERSAKQIEKELKTAGVDLALAEKYGGAAGKTGEGARKWIKDNKPLAAITEDQEKALFRGEYQRQTDSAVAFLTDPDRGYVHDGDDWKLEINFKDLKAEILAFLVDLKFRGDLNASSWKYIKPAVVANDLAELRPLVANQSDHKKHFFDNYNRYKVRCEIVGATPVAEADWKK
jgi:hypothetical protein